MRLTVLSAVGLALCPLAARAQKAVADSAQAAARATLLALTRHELAFVASHTDPLELQRTRALFEPLLRADTSNYIAHRLFRLDSTTQVHRLSDVEFATRLMTFWYGINPAFQSLLTAKDVDIAGTILHGRDSAFVVYRWLYPPDSAPMRNYQVEIMVRCPMGWCSHMAGNYSGLIGLLKQPMTTVRPKPPSSARPPNEEL